MSGPNFVVVAAVTVTVAVAVVQDEQTQVEGFGSSVVCIVAVSQGKAVTGEVAEHTPVFHHNSSADNLHHMAWVGFLVGIGTVGILPEVAVDGAAEPMGTLRSAGILPDIPVVVGVAPVGKAVTTGCNYNTPAGHMVPAAVGAVAVAAAAAAAQRGGIHRTRRIPHIRSLDARMAVLHLDTRTRYSHSHLALRIETFDLLSGTLPCCPLCLCASWDLRLQCQPKFNI